MNLRIISNRTGEFQIFREEQIEFLNRYISSIVIRNALKIEEIKPSTLDILFNTFDNALKCAEKSLAEIGIDESKESSVYLDFIDWILTKECNLLLELKINGEKTT